MGRTVLSSQRLSNTMRTNIGRILIFCEGKTEKYYFNYFAEIINKYKYNDIEVILESANGNAKAVLNHANDFMNDEANIQKFRDYSKYLVFDCDAPQNIQSVILDAQKYQLLISNHLFETWLLMHFEEVDKEASKSQIYSRLSAHLNNTYKKGQKGKTREIISNGNIQAAIDNAKRLDEKYKKEGKNILMNIKEMNPFTSVYELVEQFMIEISV